LTILSSSPIPSGTQGFSYAFTFSASGGLVPYQWTITSGSVPPNTSLDINTATLGGVLAGGSSGTYNFNVTCTDANLASVTSPFSLFIA
jgi:FAD/FMN-containing dehydrogenase